MASLYVHQDQENTVEQPKRTLREIKTNVPLQTQTRAVLGQICKNQPLTRAQGLKQSKKDISKLERKGIPQGFIIHEDGGNNQIEKGAKVKNVAKPEDLPSNVVGLHRVPLQELTSSENKPEIIGDMSIEVLDEDQRLKPTLAHLTECEEYREDIYEYLLLAESRHRPKPYYMKKQPDISYSMRSILIDWLVEVAEEYNLQSETLYLAVSYIDRFLSVMSVVRGKLQLVGTAAMFIAAKYEEIYPPDVGEFVYITDDTYTKRQVLRMEHLILKVLGFDMNVPTCLGFIITYSTTLKSEESLQYLAMYLAELSLMEADPFLEVLPSVLAASALALARHSLKMDVVWPLEYQEETGYSLASLRPCISELNKVFEEAPTRTQQAIREKYKTNGRRNVSNTAWQSIDRL